LDTQYVFRGTYKNIGHPICYTMDEKQDSTPYPPDCCDMRGFLSFTILWILRKKEMYGQEIADELEKMRGVRPNPGTIYPALQELEKQGAIGTRKEGRKTIYTLTETGQKGAIEACEYFCSVFGDIFTEYNETIKTN
jgi:PadR family transcriptional regulator PadR